MIIQPENDTEVVGQKRQQSIVAEVYGYDGSDPPPTPRAHTAELPEIDDPPPSAPSHYNLDPETSLILDQLERESQGIDLLICRWLLEADHSQSVAIDGLRRPNTESHGVPNHSSSSEPSPAGRIVVQSLFKTYLVLRLTEEQVRESQAEVPPPYVANDNLL